MKSQISEGFQWSVESLPAETLVAAIVLASAALLVSMYLLVRYRLGNGDN